MVSSGALPNPLASLEPRIAWLDAVRRESARSSRYRRPAAVLVLACEATVGGPDAAAWPARLAGPIAITLHRGIRETDIVTRTGDARFQVLLPETGASEAASVAERVIGECRAWVDAIRAPVAVRAVSAATTPDSTLDMALERALAAIEPAPPA